MHSFALHQGQPDVIVQHAAWPALTAFVASYVIIGALSRSRLALAALDHPNRRSLHVTPTPRIGGLGVVAGISSAAALLPSVFPLALWVSLAAVFAVSFGDDTHGVPVAVRFAIQLGAAAFFCAQLGAGPLDIVGAVAGAIALTWMMNLYNFMDGADGMAGGMALFGFAFYAVAAALAGHPEFAAFNVSVAAAAAAFLCYNFHPARVFLGDAGSVPLGFLAGAVGLFGHVSGVWPGWFPVLVFSPFIADATVTLARRALRRERVWQAHFDHYYQRVIRIGWSHRKAALAEYVVMFVSGAAAVTGLALDAGRQVALLGAAAVVYLALAVAIDRAWHRHQRVQAA